MAISSTGSAPAFPSVNAKNAVAAYIGLYINSPWEGWIKGNNDVHRTDISDKFKATYVTAITSYTLFASFSQIELSLSPERVTAFARGLVPDPRGPYFYAALLLVALTAAKVFKECELNQPLPLEADDAISGATVQHQPPPTLTTMDKVIVVISNATPYLMIVTNIAVTIIQIRSGHSEAWVKLAFISITLIDITSWKPQNYRRLLDTVLGYPVAAAAFYYGNNDVRFTILFNMAITTNAVKKKIAEMQIRTLQMLQSLEEEDED